MRFFQNDTGSADACYEPNSVGGPAQDPAYRGLPLWISGDASRYDHRAGHDDYTQAADLFRRFTQERKERLLRNIAEAMRGMPEPIVRRQLAHFTKADPAYGAGGANAVGLKA